MQADFVLDYDVLSVQQPQKLYLMARLTSGPAPGERQRRPLNLSLVLDRSGSMAGSKLDYTLQAAQFLVQNLGKRDLLSIVLYNDKVVTFLPPEPVVRKDAVAQRISSIKAGGTTNLSGGWLEGCTLVAQNLDALALNRVILMSDGHANRGIIDPDKLVTIAQQKREEGVSTTTMGLGQDFNEDLLMGIASAGGGAFYFIESPEVTPTIFQEELQGLLSLVGQNLIITVQPTEAVEAVKQLNAYPVQLNERAVAFRMGDVFGEEIKSLLLELTIPGLEQTGVQQIATLRFEYDELSESGIEHRVWELPVQVNVAQELHERTLSNPEVRQSVLLLQAANARREAVKAADAQQFDDASQLLRTAAQQIQDSGILDPKLAEEHEALIKQANEIEQGASAYDDYSRKTMATQAIYTMTGRHEDTVVLRMREMQRKAEQSPVVRRPGVTPTAVSWNGQRFLLEGDLIRIGRSRHNEIVLNNEGVSRFHCHIKRENEQMIIEDLGSMNGTLVDGKRLEQPYVLSAGDVIEICDERLIFETTAPS